ncbi:unnamed protein product, partial [Owenia fusiformis]
LQGGQKKWKPLHHFPHIFVILRNNSLIFCTFVHHSISYQPTLFHDHQIDSHNVTALYRTCPSGQHCLVGPPAFAIQNVPTCRDMARKKCTRMTSGQSQISKVRSSISFKPYLLRNAFGPLITVQVCIQRDDGQT